MYVYTVGVNIEFPYRWEKTVVLRRTNVFKTVTVYRFYGVYTLTIFTCHFRLTPPKSINEKSRSNRRTRAKLAEEKRLIDEKSINNRRTEAERATRTAETIDGLERNWREEKLLIDDKSRNNRWTEAELATIGAGTIALTD